MVIACPQIVEKYVEARPKKFLWVDLRALCLGVQRRPSAHTTLIQRPCVWHGREHAIPHLKSHHFSEPQFPYL